MHFQDDETKMKQQYGDAADVDDDGDDGGGDGDMGCLG